MRQLLQIGAHIHSHLAAAMHAADAAGREDVDARHIRQNHRGGNGGRAGQLLRDDDRQIAAADLEHALRLAHAHQLILGQAALEAAVDNRHRRRNRALLADDLLHLAGEAQVLRIRHAVAEDSALQRDDGLAGADSLLDFRGDVHVGFQIELLHLIYSFTIVSIAAGDISRLMVSLDAMATMPAPMPKARISSAA